MIQLLLQSGTELFVSYSHNVADLMQVKDWETHGKASGMQATESAGTAVFVSASGDPFFEGEHKTYTTDGFPALARMVVIAGQELGHFSDLRRAQDGRILGRYSTDAMHSQLRADPVPGAGRIADMTQVARLKEAYHRAGLSRLRRAEHGVAFYHKRWRYSPPWWFYQSWRFMAWLLFLISCKNRHIHLKLGTYPYHRHGEALELYLADMAFNLAPDADVYRNPDPLVEEAIAVIEAVARVPQQVHKWGHSGVRLAWPNLYRFYYSTIIPGCMRAVPQPISAQNINKLQLFKARLRRRFRPRPGYYP